MQEKFTTFLFKLPVGCIEKSDDDVILFHLPTRVHHCPKCQSALTEVHGYYAQKLKGFCDTEPTYIYKKRRFRCQDCGKTFYEENPFIEKFQQMPRAMIDSIVREHGETISSQLIAKRHGISTPTAMRHFHKTLAKDEKSDTLGAAISMDEFSGHAGGRTYQVIINNLADKSCCNVLSNRAVDEAYKAIAEYSPEVRSAVKTVSIDLSPFFRKLILEMFPNAEIAADHFHAVRLANEAVNKVRIKEWEESSDPRKDKLKYGKLVLSKRKENLTEKEKVRLEEMFSVSPTLEKAYNLKEEYFDLFSAISWQDFKARLNAFDENVQAANLKHFRTVLKTTISWQVEIWHGIKTGYNNGFTEGCNNTIKVLKRVCYNFRNFENFRRRILYILNNPNRKERRSVAA